MFFAGQVLETVTQDSARFIMTGQAQSGGYSQSQFKTYVCGKISVLFDCANGIYVDVQSYPAFSGVSVSDPIDGSKSFVPPNNYAPGGPGDIVVVRVFYQWPLYLSLFGFSLSNMSGGKRLLVVTSAFRNEPYAN